MEYTKTLLSKFGGIVKKNGVTPRDKNFKPSSAFDVKLNTISNEFINKDFKSPVINVKMINLNRQTTPLYKRLDDKNKTTLIQFS